MHDLSPSDLKTILHSKRAYTTWSIAVSCKQMHQALDDAKLAAGIWLEMGEM